MPIVTITSDFGDRDYYLAMIKGAILSLQPEVTIVDITHNIDPYDIVQAAFALRNAYSSFPEGTIHIASINNFYSKSNCFIALREKEHYFLGPDNGVFSLVFEVIPRAIYELEIPRKSNFPLKEIFAEAVNHLCSGKPFNEIGLPLDAIDQRIGFQPVIGPDRIQGTVIYIDAFENVITNIRSDLFKKVAKGRRFALHYKRNDPIRKLCKFYYDVNVGDRLCLFNSADYLEIAINMGKAASLLGLKVEDTIQIDFFT